MYLLVIFYSVFLLIAGDPQTNARISSQLRAFQEAVSDASADLAQLRDSFQGANDDKQLRQRRHNIDQLLANFQKDAVMADEVVANGDWPRMIDEERLDMMCGSRSDSCGPKKSDKHGDICKKDPCDDMRSSVSNVKKKRKYANGGYNGNNRLKESVAVADDSEGSYKMPYEIWSDSENADAINGNYQGINGEYDMAADVEKKQYDFEEVPLDDVAYDDVNYASLVNDQVNPAPNDLSHEANYKLSKIEQDAAEKRKVKGMPLIKRSTAFNPMNEIKLKTSRRMMRKGYGPSLPSYSLSDTRRDMLIDDLVKKMERSYYPNSNANANPNSNFEYEKFKVLDELSAKDSKRRGNSYGGHSNVGLNDIDRGRVVNGPVKRFISPTGSFEYDDRSRDKRYAVGGETASQSAPAVEEKKPESLGVAAADSQAKLSPLDAKEGQESKLRVKRIDGAFSNDQNSASLLKLGADFGFVANEGRSTRAVSGNEEAKTKAITEEDKATQSVAKVSEEQGVRKKRYAATNDEFFDECNDFDSMELNEDEMHSRLKRSSQESGSHVKKRHKRSLDEQLDDLNMDSKNDNGLSGDTEQKSFEKTNKNYGNGKFDSLWYEQDILQDIDIPKKKTSRPRFGYSKLVDGDGDGEEKHDGFEMTFDLQSKGFKGNKETGGDGNYVPLSSDNYDGDHNNKNKNRHNNVKDENANKASSSHGSEKGPMPIILIEAKPVSYDNDERRLHSETSDKNEGRAGKIGDVAKVNSLKSDREKTEPGHDNTKDDKDKQSGQSLRDEILNCKSFANLQKILQKIRANDTIESESELPNATADDKPDQNVKLNITINASVAGNQKAKNFSGNGTLNVRNGLLEDRERRLVRGLTHQRQNRLLQRHRQRGPHKLRDSSRIADCKTPGESNEDDADNSALENMVTGKLSQQLVNSVMSFVRSNPTLKPLIASFKRQPHGSRDPKNFYSLRNKGNGQQVKNTEHMLNKAMSSIGDIIEQQVMSRTCIPLRPDLMAFYELILKSYTDQDPGRERRSNAANWLSDFTKDIRALDPNQIDEKSRIVKKLLQQYEELPLVDRAQAIGVRNDLLRDLMYLRKVKENQAILLERRKRLVVDNAKLNLPADAPEAVRALEAKYTPEFMKLVKAASIYRDVSNEAMADIRIE